MLVVGGAVGGGASVSEASHGGRGPACGGRGCAEILDTSFLCDARSASSDPLSLTPPRREGTWILRGEWREPLGGGRPTSRYKCVLGAGVQGVRGVNRTLGELT